MSCCCCWCCIFPVAITLMQMYPHLSNSISTSTSNTNCICVHTTRICRCSFYRLSIDLARTLDTPEGGMSSAGLTSLTVSILFCPQVLRPFQWTFNERAMPVYLCVCVCASVSVCVFVKRLSNLGWQS